MNFLNFSKIASFNDSVNCFGTRAFQINDEYQISSIRMFITDSYWGLGPDEHIWIHKSNLYRTILRVSIAIARLHSQFINIS